MNANKLSILELFLIEKMTLVGAEEITNIRLRDCEFKLQITMFYFKIGFLLAK